MSVYIGMTTPRRRFKEGPETNTDHEEGRFTPGMSF
ncbi:hypothetical protein ES705_03978 [subsurface metagenome]